MKTIKSRAMILGVAAVALSLSTATTVRAAHPFNLDSEQRAVEKVAPPFPTIPGTRLCVCPDPEHNVPRVGYLNSFTNILGQAGENFRVSIVCAYTEFDAVTQLRVDPANNYCTSFTEIK
jgi:hypothetical protein